MNASGYAIVTGASGGLGLEIAKLFAENGISLILIARSRDRLDEISMRFKNDHKVDVKILDVDLIVPGAIQRLVDLINRENLGVEFLVNNAGVGDLGQFKDRPWSVHERILRLNLMVLTELTYSILPFFLKRGKARILNVASTAAFQPAPNFAVYTATKAYVLSLSEALHHELRPFGITVTALCPGATDTNFHDVAGTHKAKFLRSGVMMSSRKVAEIGYRAMMKGKLTVIAGWANFLLAQSVRFTPRAIVLKISGWIMGS